MISVVMVTYNSEACVGACIDALAEWLPDAERLVIDNASTDGSRTVAERHGATVVALAENIGFGRACNVGARRAKHDYVLFLNPDVTVRGVDRSALVELFGAASFGLIVPAATSTFMFSERRWAQEMLSLTLGALRPRELPRSSPARGDGSAVWASGAVLLVRVSEFLELGGFDARYFMYFEDRELSWRYRRSGLPVGATPALVADHLEGRSSDTGDRRSRLLAYSLMGWLQYTYVTRGPATAAHAARLALHIHATAARLVSLLAKVLPRARVRRKALQLQEVTEELQRISLHAGRLEQSDDFAYWPDATRLIDGERRSRRERSGDRGV